MHVLRREIYHGVLCKSRMIQIARVILTCVLVWLRMMHLERRRLTNYLCTRPQKNAVALVYSILLDSSRCSDSHVFFMSSLTACVRIHRVPSSSHTNVCACVCVYLCRSCRLAVGAHDIAEHSSCTHCCGWRESLWSQQGVDRVILQSARWGQWRIYPTGWTSTCKFLLLQLELYTAESVSPPQELLETKAL